jgi:hypothetical protein
MESAGSVRHEPLMHTSRAAVLAISVIPSFVEFYWKLSALDIEAWRLVSTLLRVEDLRRIVTLMRGMPRW